MPEYIEREAMQLALHELRLRNVHREMRGRIYEDTISLAFLALADIPAADVAPVVHAKWIDRSDPDEDGNIYEYCSKCGHGDLHSPGIIVPFCWFCGAKMDGGDDHG